MKSRFSLGLKLTISNLIFVIPILVLLNLYIRSVGENIKFAESELQGDRYQRPLMSLLDGLGRHRVVAQRALYGDPKSREQLPAISEEIDLALKELEAEQAKLGADLQFTPEGLGKRKREHNTVKTLEDEWGKLKSEIASIKAEASNERHAHLIGDVRTMITHAGDTSNLILDPDLDSYYLMDGTLVTIPQMMDRLQDILVNGERTLRRRSISAEDRVSLAVFAALLKQSDLDRFTGDIQTTLNEDANFYGVSLTVQSNLPRYSSEVAAAVEPVVKLLNDVATGGESNIKTDSFVIALERAYGTSYKAWKGSVDELDILLKKRIESFAQKRNLSLIVSLLAVLLATLIASILGLSIKKGILEGISEAVKRIREVSSNIDSSSQNMVATSQTLSSAANQQASAIQETAATLSEIDAMVQKTAGNVARSSEEMSQTEQAASVGKNTLQQVISAIANIKSDNQRIMESVNESNQKILDIVRVVQEIGTKTQVINDIVFQTKLLSFNASVEAARAGEHGKGFAVVAEEVGNLAQMSGNAAKEISEMLEGSVSRVNGIVDENRRSIETLISAAKKRIDDGLVVAEKCMEVFGDMTGRITGVTQLISDVNEAARQQATGVNEITRAIQEMDKSTQENATSSEQTARYAEDLAQRAAFLKDVVGELEKKTL